MLILIKTKQNKHFLSLYKALTMHSAQSIVSSPRISTFCYPLCLPTISNKADVVLVCSAHCNWKINLGHTQRKPRLYGNSRHTCYVQTEGRRYRDKVTVFKSAEQHLHEPMGLNTYGICISQHVKQM